MNILDLCDDILETIKKNIIYKKNYQQVIKQLKSYNNNYKLFCEYNKNITDLQYIPPTIFLIQ